MKSSTALKERKNRLQVKGRVLPKSSVTRRSSALSKKQTFGLSSQDCLRIVIKVKAEKQRPWAYVTLQEVTVKWTMHDVASR